MKICYVVPLELNKTSGVLQKIRCQVSEWINKGHEVQVCYISIVTPSIELFPWEISYTANIKKSNEISRMIWRAYFCYKIRGFLDANKVDVLYFRFVFWFPGLISFLSSYQSFIELNSHDLNEFSKKNTLLKISYKWIRKQIFRSACGVVGVSEDICESLHGYTSKVYLLANGYKFDLSSFPVKSIRNNNIVFISSPSQYWQGLDIIVSLMSKLPNYMLHVVGWSELDFKSMYGDIHIPKNVIFLGYKSEIDVRYILEGMDYAFNAMGMHRKGMLHNSALKTAQYLNANLPIVSGYIETGIADAAILHVDSRNNNIDIDRVNSFFEYWSDKNVDIDNINNQLSTEVIECNRLKIFSGALE